MKEIQGLFGTRAKWINHTHSLDVLMISCDLLQINDQLFSSYVLLLVVAMLLLLMCAFISCSEGYKTPALFCFFCSVSFTITKLVYIACQTNQPSIPYLKALSSYLQSTFYCQQPQLGSLFQLFLSFATVVFTLPTYINYM